MKGTVLYPPYTTEDILRVHNKQLSESVEKLKKRVRTLEYENGKLFTRNQFLESLIEMTRAMWHKGEKFSIQEMLACLKSGTITARYQSLGND